MKMFQHLTTQESKDRYATLINGHVYLLNDWLLQYLTILTVLAIMRCKTNNNY